MRFCLAVLCLIVVGCHAEEIEKKVAEARDVAKARDGKRIAGLRKAATASTGACPVKYARVDLKDAVAPRVLNAVLKRNRIAIVAVGELDQAMGVHRAEVEKAAKDLKESTDSASLERANALLSDANWQPELTMIIDEEVVPRLVSKDEFSPGSLKARAFVWDYQQQAITCASSTSVKTPDEISVMTLGKGALTDLEKEGIRGSLWIDGLNAAIDALASVH